MCSTKVQNTDTSELDKQKNMLRMVHNMSASRGLFLEPYVSSVQVFANYTSATRKSYAKLLKQPVPKLKDTLDKYLRSVQPFLNVKQMRKTTSLVRDFEQGLGSKLQVLLEKRAEELENWLEDWWLTAAYLEYRDPVVVHSSPGLLLPFGTVKNASEQLEFAAKILLGSLEYKAKIDSDQYPQDMMGKTPLDMGQYKKIFGTCRIPLEKRDKLVFHSNSRHIIVLHNNHIFRVDLWGQDNVQLNANQIVEQLKIVMDKSPSHNENGVGILTSEHRDNWAKSYQILMKDPKNQEFMKDVHESLVALCLDAPCGYLETEKPDCLRSRGGAQTIHGCGSKSNGGNRWFDKTIQFIVGAEGLAGMSYEHSPAEGQPIAILTDFLIEYSAKHKDSAPPSKSPIPPKYLEFKVTPELQPLIREAETNLDTLADNLFLHCFKFQNFGKGFIKSQKLSPDSFIQMAIQYAFYRLHREPCAHYESAATRMYKGGRTETIRSCSIESVEFAKAMLNPVKTTKDRIEALKKAITSHKNYTVQALQGLGVDRHLLGLKLIAQANGIELHDLYKDVSYTKSSHMRMSTSQVAFKAEAFMCYGPLVSNGYATCYNPRENDILFGVSSFKDDPDTDLYGYKEALVKSLEDMHNLFVQNTPSKL